MFLLEFLALAAALSLIGVFFPKKGNLLVSFGLIGALFS